MIFFHATTLVILIATQFTGFVKSSFNASECGLSKQCIGLPANCHAANGNIDKCDFLFAYSKKSTANDGSPVIEMDLVGRVESPAEPHYVAFGFSGDEYMGDEPIISCIFEQDGTVNPILSRNIEKSNHLFDGNSAAFLNLVESSVSNGVSHCRIVQDFGQKMDDNNYRADPKKQKFLLGAVGPAEPGNVMSYHEKRKVVGKSVRLSDAPSISVSSVPESEFSFGLAPSTTTLLVRFHGIFMIIAWLACVSMAVFSARYLRNTFGKKFSGIKLWFHVHRTLNIIAVLLIILSAICIGMAKDMTWSGPWFSKSTSSNIGVGALHSLFGAMAVIFAISQPFNSLLRCSPDHRNRFIFNLIHRSIGIFGLMSAFVALFIAVFAFGRHFTSGPDLAKGVLVATVITALALVVTAEIVGNRRVGKRVASMELSVRTGKHQRSDSDAFSYQQSASGETRAQKTVNRVIFGIFAAAVLTCTIALVLLIE